MHKGEAKKCGRSPTTVSGILPVTMRIESRAEWLAFSWTMGKSTSMLDYSTPYQTRLAA
jgi:hypothetical protein